jgi:hypothetical protein
MSTSKILLLVQPLILGNTGQLLVKHDPHNGLALPVSVVALAKLRETPACQLACHYIQRSLYNSSNLFINSHDITMLWE